MDAHDVQVGDTIEFTVTGRVVSVVHEDNYEVPFTSFTLEHTDLRPLITIPNGFTLELPHGQDQITTTITK